MGELRLGGPRDRRTRLRPDPVQPRPLVDGTTGLRDRQHHQRQGGVLHGGPRRVASQSPHVGPDRDGAAGVVGMTQQQTQRQTLQAPTYDCRKAFAEELIALAREDERIVAVCNDSVGSSNLVRFREEFPDRLINVGIAEQDLVGVGAGLANGGMVPFVSAAAPFLTGRALEQIKADLAYSDTRVILCGQSPGMAYGELGPTHHSIEDLSWLRAIANLSVLVPADRAQTRAAVRWAVANPGPLYLRVPRFKVPEVTPEDAPLEPGQAITVSDGDDITIVAVGTMVSRAIDAAERL